MAVAVQGHQSAERGHHAGKRLVQGFFRGLRSSSLAIALLLALAVLAAVGTITSPQGPDAAAGSPVARLVGLERTFRSPLFLALVGAAVLNVVACSWHRLGLRRRAGAMRWRLLTDLLLHGSLLLVLVGGVIKGARGFTGTQNVYVGESTDAVYDWAIERDAPLGFRLRIEEFQQRYYPLRAKIGVRRADTGEKLALLDVAEGAETGTADGRLRLRVGGFDPDAGSIQLDALAGERWQRAVLKIREAGAATARAGAYDLTLVAYRADLRQVRARVTLEEAGAPVQQGWLTTNDRLRRRGTNIFLTAWGSDDAGRRFCGIQVVRDPGAPFFWAGCVLLAFAVPAHLLVKGRSSGTAVPGGEA